VKKKTAFYGTTKRHKTLSKYCFYLLDNRRINTVQELKIIVGNKIRHYGVNPEKISEIASKIFLRWEEKQERLKRKAVN
jgi:hypothetical protein